MLMIYEISWIPGVLDLSAQRLRKVHKHTTPWRWVELRKGRLVYYGDDEEVVAARLSAPMIPRHPARAARRHRV